MRRRLHALCVGWLLASACSRSLPHSASVATAGPASVKVPLAGRQELAPLDLAAPSGGAEVSASGVASRQLRAGQGGASPKPNDCVRLSYTSWKRDGSLHASTARDGQAATQCLR